MSRRPAEKAMVRLIAQNNDGLERLIAGVRERGEVVSISKRVEPYIMFGGYRAEVVYIPKA